MRSFLFFLVLVCASCSYALATPIPSKIQKATVYLKGAHLYYSENVSLAAGESELIFENISPHIVPGSLQAGTTAGFVMDIKHKVTYKEAPAVTPKRYDKEIKLVLDSLEDLAYQIKGNQNSAEVARKEKELLLKNPLMSGASPRDSLELLKETLAFLREKLDKILKEELRLGKALAKLKKREAELRDRYNGLVLLQNGAQTVRKEAEPIHQVIITVYNEAASTAKVNFNYLVQNAYWIPHYEMATQSADKTMDLHYFGYISQTSGLDWKGIPITLSTFNPGGSNTKPELTPWYLSYLQYKNDMMSNQFYKLEEQSLSLSKPSSATAGAIDDYVTVNDNLLRTEYEIKLKYTIPSGDDKHKVLINKKELPVGLQFAAVPKLSNDAFLMATVTGWEDMNIIPGPARLYFDGSYVGETYLNAETTQDTLRINLGHNQQIAMTRKKIKEKISTKFIGGEKVETRSIELVVRNINSQEVDLVLEDQIPVANANEEIKIKLLGSDKAGLENHTGKLTWNLKLKPKESRTIVFTYEVRYPGDKLVYGL